MRKSIMFSLILLGIAMMVLAGCKSSKNFSSEEKKTVKGKFQEVKDGYEVGEMVVTREALEEFGADKDNLRGMMVEITGYTKIHEWEKSYLDEKGKVVYVQSKEGSTEYMTKIESLRFSRSDKEEMPLIKIQETTPGEVCGIIVGAGNIFKDGDGIRRVTFSLPGAGNTFRLAQGEYLNFKGTQIFVEEIVEALPKKSKGKSPGSSQSYVVLSCIPKGKPYAAPEGVKAEEVNAPNS